MIYSLISMITLGSTCFHSFWRFWIGEPSYV